MNFKPMVNKLLVSGLAVTLLAGAAGASASAKGNVSGKGNLQVGAHAKVQITINFTDLQGSGWAGKYIAKLASKRVFEGYGDGTFQPRKPITRIEAITAAVRLMGLRDQAESSAEMNANLNFKDANLIEKKYAWATGYVAVAAENDLFMENDTMVQPQKAADRLWSTMLLVKALKLDAEAKANMNAKLTFKDADKIPAGSVGYVKVAVDKGLITGYEDGSFRPERPVTRAELAALLDRTGDQMPAQDQNQATATLTAAANGNVLTVTKDGQTSSVTVDAGAYIYRDGAKAAITDLKAGDELKIQMYNNVAYFIEVTKPAAEQQTSEQQAAFTVTGLFSDMTVNAEGKIATVTITQNTDSTVQEAVYDVSPTVTITGGTLPAPSKTLELKGEGTLVTDINILGNE